MRTPREANGHLPALGSQKANLLTESGRSFVRLRKALVSTSDPNQLFVTLILKDFEEKDVWNSGWIWV